ncbi:Type II intron maturase [Pelagirhabdus alkalitolerans]|uniref:Type II intron maturase n=1 Tax=Pelagirhabdus alkalitolerans TaxID=1612202 RepID=A0A1G6HPY8_9BACI|nr:group II intron reverse transcriptase/maturase [Pelagirhabdus alkalitolerans]SDB95915.1 Type II intron maturase [Pelagirhabdus alkalitolerans]
MAVDPFQQLDAINRASKKGHLIKDCYRLMYKESIWYQAYANLYPLDNLQKLQSKQHLITDITDQLKEQSFRFTQKKERTGRSVHSISDVTKAEDLVLEVMRIILYHIYYPMDSQHVYGCSLELHYTDGLSQLKESSIPINWCICMDLPPFDSKRHGTFLLKQISEKISDHRFLLLLHNGLNTGSIQEDACSNSTPSSDFHHLLTHILLQKVDRYILETKQNVRMNYVRYNRSIFIGIKGDKKGAMCFRDTIVHFLKDNHLIGVTSNIHLQHLKKPNQFLGYAIQLNDRNKRKIDLRIPRAELSKLASHYRYGQFDPFKPAARPNLLSMSECDILSHYNHELSQIAYKYQLASNQHHLSKLFYLAEGSFLKTMAAKRKRTVKQVALSMRRHAQGRLSLVVPASDGSKKTKSFIKLKDVCYDTKK